MKIYYDRDADLEVLNGKSVAVVGYGNQGRAQALNMRDSGVEVIVGSIRDTSYERAESDGFEVMPIPVAVKRADIICILIPDEIQTSVYSESIAPNLRRGNALYFSHGYAIRYRRIEPPAGVDVIMVAPRMIGVGVRTLFEKGKGAPAFIAVERDETGNAWSIVAAMAKAIGATRAGALVSSFAEETEIDHFAEQAIYPTIIALFKASFELLVARGYQPEAVLMDMYISGEAAEVMDAMATHGMFAQMRLHSRTSQYGTITRSQTALPEELKSNLTRRLDEIKSGEFSTEWETEQAAGYPVFEKLMKEALSHPINEVEKRIKDSFI